MKAVIMAGGKGTRLRPLTCNKPKPMVPIANRPMMEHIVNLLRKHHFDDVMVTLFYLGESIENYFGDGSQFGLRMRYFTEEKPLGTAGSVKNGADFLDETFLVISGDALTDIDLEAAVAFHKEKGSLATLVLTRVDNPLEYGVVITDAEGRIRRFLEKPGWGEVFSDTVNTGIYILEPEVLNYFNKGQVFDFSKDLFPLLLAKGEPMYGYVASGYWSDIGNLEQYRQAHFDVLTGKIRVSIPGREIQPGIWVGEGVQIDADASLEAPILLGDYCQIESGAHIGAYTVMGNYGCVQEGSSIKRSVLWDHCYLGANSEVRGAILCHHNHLKGKNAVFEGAVLGEGVSLGIKSIIKPQVKVWPDKAIDSGTVLNESVIWAKKCSRSLFGNAGISGTINQEITPELTAKYGAVFGSRLKPGSRIVVSSDNFRASRVFKRALVAGVLSAGVHVYDLGTIPTPVTRYALVSLGAQGGVHLRIDDQDADSILIEFFDDRGLNIDKSSERAMENSFLTEDFPRATGDTMGEIAFVPQLIEPYLQGMLPETSVKAIAQRRFKIVALYEPGSLSLILPTLFEKLGCEVIPGETIREDAVNRPRTLQELLNALSRVEEQTRQHRADLGIIVDHNAERLILLDENGDLLKEEQFMALLAYYVFKYQPEASIPAPVTAPHVLEAMAKEFRGRVIRTKANPRSLMEREAEERLFPTLSGESSYHPQFDAVFSLVKILELLARENLSLAGAKLLIPDVPRKYQEVDCPWEHKGRIMRNLFEENKEHQVEMTDGLKVYHEQGWALVLPDAEEPVFRIYAEAGSYEEADALTQMYINRIQELQME
ncbi:MAG TPA: mannose-1-phosphate guanyltransferase [Bacillota bacterium]|nr:mannose-1-phosphate guanyltransferase [Bacillota bacterium]